MRHLLLIIYIISSFSLLFTQEKEEFIPFISYWSVGDTYDYKVTKIKQNWKNGKLIKSDSGSYYTRLEILDSTETSYKIKWHIENDFTEFGVTNEFYKKYDKYRYTDVIYKTSELGEFQEIENWEELSSQFQLMAQDLINYSPSSSQIKITKPELIQKLTPLLEAFSSKEGLEYFIYNEIPVLHFPFGMEFSSLKSEEYIQELPNILGGKPLRGNTTITIDSLSKVDYYCRVKSHMKIDSDDAKDFIYSFLKKLDLESKEFKKFLKTSFIDIQDRNTYEYFYNPGIPIDIETTRKSFILVGEDMSKSVTTLRIEWIKDR